MKKNKKFLIITLTLIMVFSSFTMASAEKKEPPTKPFTILVNWVPLNIDDISGFPFINKQNRTLVPIRVISEGLGYEVTWNQEAKVAQISDGKNMIYLKYGSSIAVVNGKQVPLDSTVVVRDNRVMVPIRFISESFGVTVNYYYNPSAHIINLVSK